MAYAVTGLRVNTTFPTIQWGWPWTLANGDIVFYCYGPLPFQTYVDMTSPVYFGDFDPGTNRRYGESFNWRWRSALPWTRLNYVPPPWP